MALARLLREMLASDASAAGHIAQTVRFAAQHALCADWTGRRTGPTTTIGAT